MYGLSVGADGTIRYVGITRRGIRNRLAEHKHIARNGGKYAVSHWIQKHGEQNIHARELYRAKDSEDMKQMEIQLIREMNESGASLLNLTPGGDGPTRFHSPEARALISEALRTRKRKPHSAATRRRISEVQKGVKATEISRARASATMQGMTEPDAYLKVLESWKVCEHCGDRYAVRQMREHRYKGMCSEDVNASELRSSSKRCYSKRAKENNT